MPDEWIELPSNRSTSKFFVRPTSYLLMGKTERERKWVEDVELNRQPAAAWINAVQRGMDLDSRMAKSGA